MSKRPSPQRTHPRKRPIGNAGARRPSRIRSLVFHALAVLLPFLLLAFVELGLRLAGFGGYPPILASAGADGPYEWIATSRAGTNTFFQSGSALTGGMREVQFTRPKQPNTVRIVIVGGSAAQGFPQPLPVTNGSFLAAMLHDAWAGSRGVEVLNLGATAVASFPALCILREALDQDPDLVVVMSGNNEFYGAYGVSSLHSAGRTPAGMRVMRELRRLALTQAIERLRPAEAAPSGPLMEQVAVSHAIGPQDRLRRSAAGTLRADLVEMVRRCREREVPVLVCTVPTNERNLAPIGRDVPVEELRAAEELLATDPAAAEPAAARVIASHPDHARAHFVRAQALTALDRPDEAAPEYVTARDLDRMPWRATTAARQAVLAAAAGPGATLCDMETAFRAASPGGSIGEELMDDHVHMTVAGQALFARTVVRAMTGLPAPLHVDPAAADALPDGEQYAQRLGRSVYTDYVAANRIRSLFKIPFMRENNGERAAHAEDVCNRLQAAMSDVDREAVERWRDPALHGATDRPLTWIVGLYRMESGDYAAAAELFRTARQSVPTVSLWRLELTWLLLGCRRHVLPEPEGEDALLCREAVAIGEILDRLGAEENADVLRYLGLAYHLAGDFPQAIRCLERSLALAGGVSNQEAVAALADAYRQTGRPEDAHR
jgi:tetratricopeptide (TPR) repeat protein